eukprot:TRINITY_DN21144_c0_g1_i1.p1 TRINITY_DN21144_c0_g1~~TRINITY_DN21144_c0_g1_i1.p1  ORF type:complete len:438 (+),score=78.91 TRINITY_DN21144_c0_g1_i1:61-1374(+)
MALPCSKCHRVMPSSDDMMLQETNEDSSDAVVRLEAKAIALAEAGHMRKAAELFARATRLAPQEAKLHESLAQCLLELDLVGEACEAASKAAALRPEWCVAHATLGRAQLGAGLLQDAVNSLANAVRLGKTADVSQQEASLVAEVEAEMQYARTLLEQHWAQEHDVIVHAPRLITAHADGGKANCAPVSPLRIRQWVECNYCHLCGEHGPGGAVWAAGVVLAAFIRSCASGHVSPSPAPQTWQGLRVLELGSGTGIGGLAAAAAGAHVLLSDRGPLLPLMELNMELNSALLQAAGGTVDVAAYDWLESTPARIAQCPPWDVIVASDFVYSFASVDPFCDVLSALLHRRDSGGSFSTNAPCPALLAHNRRSAELDAEVCGALKTRGLRMQELPLPPGILSPVGRVSLQALQRVVLWYVDVQATLEAVPVKAAEDRQEE